METKAVFWQAVVDRDASADGEFYFGVTTTGVYCRPSCPARRPLRKNVRFYESAADAERDGLRACLRCKPKEIGPRAETEGKIRKAAEYIQAHCDEVLPLANLAKQAGMSSFYFQRRFREVVGVTPKQFAEACRRKLLKKELREGGDVLQSVYGSGYGSASRVYEGKSTALGMTPAEYRDGGRQVEIHYVSLRTKLGLLMAAATERGLCFVQFGDSEGALRTALQEEYPAAQIDAMKRGGTGALREWARALDEHLKGSCPKLDLPLDVRATALEMQVWKYLQSVPYGEVRTYKQVAEGIGNAKAVRAVASAIGRNRVALAIPCHRVIRGNGESGEYRWGAERKKKLLEGERKLRG